MVYYKCGCRTYMSDHPNLFVPMVEYCPMHKAAPDLVAALEAADDIMGDVYDMVDEDKFNAVWKQVSQALAQVKEK